MSHDENRTEVNTMDHNKMPNIDKDDKANSNLCVCQFCNRIVANR